MIDLLEKENKMDIIAEYRERYLVTVFLTLGFLILIAGIVVGAVYSSAYIESLSLKGSLLALEKGGLATTTASYAKQLKETNRTIAFLAESKGNLRLASVVLDEISRVRPNGIRVTNIVLERAGSIWNLKLSGVSLRRQDVLTYTESLKRSELFTSVDSPFSNLVKDVNSDFVLNLKFESR